MFTKQSVKALHAQALEDLVELAKERGLEVRIAGGVFDGGRATLKFDFIDVAAMKAKEEEEFKRDATYVGLQPTDLGRTFLHKGKKMTIVGLKVGAKYDVRCTNGKSDVVTCFQSVYVAQALKA